MKTIDYYEYWNKNRDKNQTLLEREKMSLSFLGKIMKPGFSFLDAGCGNGNFIIHVLRRFPKTKAKGVDYSISEVKEARKKGLDVVQGNFEEGIKLKKDLFNVIYAAEIIEHLYNPDLFLSELNRMLKNHGFLIISTPNLCAWFNRILLPLGIQPIFIESSTKSKLAGAGPLKKFKKEHQPVGHVRIFNLPALKDLFKMHGFQIIKAKGSTFDEGFPKLILKIDKIFTLIPTLSSRFVILAKKIRNVSV